MTDQEQIEILRSAVDAYGAEKQINVAIEEMSELTKELCKHNRGEDNVDHIAEECADVENMLVQLLMIFDCVPAARRWQEDKINRLKERLHNV